MALISPFDLQQIIVVDVAGSHEIFTFLAIIIFAIIAGKFNFPNKITLPLFALFGVIMASYLPGLFIIINIITGLIVYFNLSKMAR